MGCEVSFTNCLHLILVINNQSSLIQLVLEQTGPQSTHAVRASSDNASPDRFHSRSKVKAHRHNSFLSMSMSTPKTIRARVIVGHAGSSVVFIGQMNL